VKQYNSFQYDLNRSIQALESIKESILKKIFCGSIHNIESSNNNILMLLDQKSGVDYIREDEKGLQGIAARVQWIKQGYKPYNSFTIRFERHTKTETEYKKRTSQIKNGYFYPAFTLQAYFEDSDNNKLISIGVIKTNDLYKFIDKNPEKVYQNKSDNVFKFVYFADLRKYGVITLPKINFNDDLEINYNLPVIPINLKKRKFDINDQQNLFHNQMLLFGGV
jgi:hypothetical protein